LILSKLQLQVLPLQRIRLYHIYNCLSRGFAKFLEKNLR